MTWLPCGPYSRRIDFWCIALSGCGSLYRRFSCSERPLISTLMGCSIWMVAMLVSMVVSSSKRSSSARKMLSSYWFLRIVLKLRSSVPVATETHESLRTSVSSGPRPDVAGIMYESGRIRYEVPCRRISEKSRSRKLPSACGAFASAAGRRVTLHVATVAGVAKEAAEAAKLDLRAFEDVVDEREELRAVDDLLRVEVEALEQLEVERLGHAIAALGEELGLGRTSDVGAPRVVASLALLLLLLVPVALFLVFGRTRTRLVVRPLRHRLLNAAHRAAHATHALALAALGAAEQALAFGRAIGQEMGELPEQVGVILEEVGHLQGPRGKRGRGGGGGGEKGEGGRCGQSLKKGIAAWDWRGGGKGGGKRGRGRGSALFSCVPARTLP